MVPAGGPVRDELDRPPAGWSGRVRVLGCSCSNRAFPQLAHGRCASALQRDYLLSKVQKTTRHRAPLETAQKLNSRPTHEDQVVQLGPHMRMP